MPPNPKFLVVGLTLAACSFSPEPSTADLADSPQQSRDLAVLDSIADELVEKLDFRALCDLYLPCARAGDAEAQQIDGSDTSVFLEPSDLQLSAKSCLQAIGRLYSRFYERHFL